MFTSMPIGIPLICYLLYASATKCKHAWQKLAFRTYTATHILCRYTHCEDQRSPIKDHQHHAQDSVGSPWEDFHAVLHFPHHQRRDLIHWNRRCLLFEVTRRSRSDVSINQQQSESIITNSLFPKVNVKIWANFYFLVRTKYVLKCKFGKISQIIP